MFQKRRYPNQVALSQNKQNYQKISDYDNEEGL